MKAVSVREFKNSLSAASRTAREDAESVKG